MTSTEHDHTEVPETNAQVQGGAQASNDGQEQRYVDVRLFTGDQIYMPIWEGRTSAPLEVQLGCSWHRCKFCDFANDERYVFSLPEIAAKAQMLIPYAQDKHRVFLLGENPLSLPMDMLRQIFEIIAYFMPWVDEIAMYARFDDVLAKTEEELEELADAGLREVHIGLESGAQEILDFMCKGIKIDDAVEACRRLHKLDIDFSFTMIAGLGGTELTHLHAPESIAFLNEVQPKHIWVTGLLLWPNTPLFKIAQEGGFHQLTFHQRLIETRDMVAGLELNDCEFVDSTVLGDCTVRGHFPEQKAEVLAAMNQLLEKPGYDHVPPIPIPGMTEQHR
ncbi:radical SAM protein [Slackia heliotrinireducens]|uniref:radical SAM protein n=1 Tax=Slackia heliotrinireducens TaxID=84110 RepID=UPI0033157382